MQTYVGKLKLVCMKDTTTVVKHVGKLLAKIETSSICRQQIANMFADCFCAVHTLQLEFVKLEFANSSLPCEDNKIVMCIASGGVVELRLFMGGV